MFSESQIFKITVTSRMHNLNSLGTFDARVLFGTIICCYIIIIIILGVVASGHYNQPGGLSDHLCVTRRPQYKNLKSGADNAALYGVEFSSYEEPLLSKVNARTTSLYQNDLVCAVCRSKSRKTQVRIRR